MSLLTREPMSELMSMRDLVDRFFEDSLWPLGRWQRWREAAEGYRLPLDAYVTDNEVVIVASVPGIKPEDIEITLEEDALTIKGKFPGRLENVNYILQERAAGWSFSRTLFLNIPVQADKAEAHFENGVLTITLPKAEAAKPKAIKVKTH